MQTQTAHEAECPPGYPDGTFCSGVTEQDRWRRAQEAWADALRFFRRSDEYFQAQLFAAQQPAANFSAGFGDTLTFGLTRLARTGWDPVDSDSGAYGAGGWAGFGVGVGLTSAGTAARAGWSVSFRYYKNAKGVGVTILNQGKRKLGLDWHRFTLRGQTVNRPHLHYGRTTSQINKLHRPWQGGWGW